MDALSCCSLKTCKGCSSCPLLVRLLWLLLYLLRPANDTGTRTYGLLMVALHRELPSSPRLLVPGK